MRGKAHRAAARLTNGAECVQNRREQGYGTKPDDKASQRHQRKAAACSVPRGSCSAGADATRDHYVHADGCASTSKSDPHLIRHHFGEITTYSRVQSGHDRL